MSTTSPPLASGKTSRWGVRLGRLSDAFAGVQLDVALFWSALLVFAITRLVGLERFPIYFFTDEAVQTVQAANLVEHGFKDNQGRLLPTYFQNGNYFNLSVSVYAQIIPYKLFGYSIFATRATSVLFALSGTAAVGLILRDIFRVRAWWLATLFLAITPAWFLHSRTAFETIVATSLYAWFLYFYLRYRVIAPRNLYPALIFGALTFYSYASIQLVVILTCAAFALSDVRYHLKNWRTALIGVALLGVLVLPYARFQLQQGHEVYLHLRTLDSYWVKPGLTLGDKLHQLWHEYKTGLSPSYWFASSEDVDLVRHLMKGYGNVLVYTAPFFFVGLGACVYRFRSAPHRDMLFALLLAPAGAALVQIQITRAMVFVVPVAVLTGLGASILIAQMSKRIPYASLAGVSFAVLTLMSFYMLNDALRNGPTWYTNYGLYGMQFGARQISDSVKQYLREQPGATIYLSHSWTNGTNAILNYLFPNEKRVTLHVVAEFQERKLPIGANAIFIMTPEEFKTAIADPKFTDIVVRKTLEYPDGRDGFYFLTMRYSDEADAIFAAEAEKRRQPVTENVTVNGKNVTVVHPRFDIGGVRDLFDGDTFTLARTLEANPAVIELTFPEPTPLESVFFATWPMNLELTVQAFDAGGEDSRTYHVAVPKSATEPRVTVDLQPGTVVSRLRIEVLDKGQPLDDAHIHIRDIKLK